MKKKLLLVLLTVTTALSLAFDFTACNVDTPDAPIDPDNNVDTGNTDNKDNNNNPPDPSVTYSNLVNNILKDDEINKLINDAKSDPSLYKSAYFDSHPYAFLANQGHNIQDIKEGQLECRTVSYTDENEPNALYILTYVENSDVVKFYSHSYNYYTEYQLKYTLSDKEMSDYTSINKGYYIQAVFLNNEISKTKKVQILSKTDVTKKSHDTLKRYLCAWNGPLTGSGPLKYKEILNSDNIDFIIKKFDNNNQTSTILAFDATCHTNHFVRSNKAVEIEAKLRNAGLYEDRVVSFNGISEYLLTNDEMATNSFYTTMYNSQLPNINGNMPVITNKNN